MAGCSRLKLATLTWNLHAAGKCQRRLQFAILRENLRVARTHRCQFRLIGSQLLAQAQGIRFCSHHVVADLRRHHIAVRSSVGYCPHGVFTQAFRHADAARLQSLGDRSYERCDRLVGEPCLDQKDNLFAVLHHGLGHVHHVADHSAENLTHLDAEALKFLVAQQVDKLLNCLLGFVREARIGDRLGCQVPLGLEPGGHANPGLHHFRRCAFIVHAHLNQHLGQRWARCQRAGLHDLGKFGHGHAHTVRHVLHGRWDCFPELLTQLFHADNPLARHLLDRHGGALEGFASAAELSDGVHQGLHRAVGGVDAGGLEFDERVRECGDLKGGALRHVGDELKITQPLGRAARLGQFLGQALHQDLHALQLAGRLQNRHRQAQKNVIHVHCHEAQGAHGHDEVAELAPQRELVLFDPLDRRGSGVERLLELFHRSAGADNGHLIATVFKAQLDDNFTIAHWTLSFYSFWSIPPSP